MKSPRMYLRGYRGLLLATALACLTSAANATVMLRATLDGAQETGGVVTGGNGTATGTLSGGAGAWVFTYSITYADLSAQIIPAAGTGGHLHAAPAGSDGGIVHTLDTAAFNYTGTTAGTIIGDWRFDDANALTDSLASTLLAGGIYINLHTANFPGGEIRGQLLVPEPGTIALLFAGLLIGLLGRKRSSRL